MRPCPRCGRHPIQFQSTVVKPRRWQGVCVRCDFAGPLADTYERAVEAWNAQLFDRAIGSEAGEKTLQEPEN